ncbi:MAG: thioredoxin fold domain-containing protein [Bacteroidetes bacterium]|nr:thioredoxin fold domain-containing protein [Bacteroidota bacterium]
MKTLSLSLLLISILFACNTSSQHAALLTPAEFESKMNTTNDFQLIDVRTSEEFSENRIENAANMDYYDERFKSHAELLDKSKPTFVYCKVGGRSNEAVMILLKEGFTEIYELKGGIMAWDKENMPMDGASTAEAGMSIEDFEKTLNTEKLVLIDFNAKWCVPCRKMAPFLEKIAEEQQDKIVILPIDADKNKLLTAKYKVDTLPALFLYKNNELVWKHTGFIDEQELRKVLLRFE